MEPTFELPTYPLDNQHSFTDPFFKRFCLRKGPTPLKDQRHPGFEKFYNFPTLYDRVRCAVSIHLCDFKEAQRILPSPRLTPISFLKGRSVIVISAYDYRQVTGLPPYLEVAFSIPVHLDHSPKVPMLPLLLPGFPGFGFHVFHMPVTNFENELRGHRFWGLPKVTQAIEFDDPTQSPSPSSSGERPLLTLFDPSTKNPYFQLHFPEGRLSDEKKTHFDVKAQLFSKQEDQLLKSPTFFKGDFVVRKNMSRLWTSGTPVPTRPSARINVGSDGFGKTLRNLKLDPHALQYRYAPHMMSAFDLPIAKMPLRE